MHGKNKPKTKRKCYLPWVPRIVHIYVNEMLYPNLPIMVDLSSMSQKLAVTVRMLSMGNSPSRLYNIFELPKHDSSKRIIEAPVSAVKRVQTNILRHVLYKIPMPAHVSGFVPTRSCASEACVHAGKRVIVKLDITNFFQYTTYAQVKSVWRKLGYNNFVSKVLTRNTTVRGHLPTGAPTSGALSNLVGMFSYDNKILDMVSGKWDYTRYADDMIFSSNTANLPDAHDLINNVGKIMRQNGYTLNQKKTKITPYYKQQRVLGLTVNVKPNVPAYAYKRLRAILYNCINKDFDAQIRKLGCTTQYGAVKHLRGLLSNYKQALTPERYTKLNMQLKTLETRYARAN